MLGVIGGAYFELEGMGDDACEVGFLPASRISLDRQSRRQSGLQGAATSAAPRLSVSVRVWSFTLSANSSYTIINAL
jgi:hypothetical protein